MLCLFCVMMTIVMMMAAAEVSGHRTHQRGVELEIVYLVSLKYSDKI